jgi:hypothetical protein
VPRTSLAVLGFSPLYFLITAVNALGWVSGSVAVLEHVLEIPTAFEELARVRLPVFPSECPGYMA